MTASDRNWRDLSPGRVAVALLCVSGLISGCALTVRAMLSPVPPPAKPSWFAPYVDVTLTPRFPFEAASSNPAKQVVLAFIVASKADPCAPTWGTAYELDAAATALDLDRRIAQYRARGGEVIGSFGGALNTELARSCKDIGKLTRAYQAVVDRYSLRTLDFDIEGVSLGDLEANARRNQAIKSVQTTQRTRRKKLDIWFTLPVASTGLTTEGFDALASMVSSGVELTGVNVMTMDFGEGPKDKPADMADLSVRALTSTVRQLRSVYKRAGFVLSSDDAWRKLGATPMIGQNDIANEVFSIDNAKLILDLAGQRSMPRISMWSLNRDSACGLNLEKARAWNTCSGVDQTENAFGWLFGTLTGRPADVATTTVPPRVVTERGASDKAVKTIVDDPKTSPYPIWNTNRLYRKDAKVVWQREVYQAKWWNVGQDPAGDIVHEWDSAWHLLGPVLPGERPAPTTTLAPKTYPAWSANASYGKHDRVQIEGTGFEAKWWTRGDAPGVDVPNAWNSPWAPIDEVEAQTATIGR